MIHTLRQFARALKISAILVRYRLDEVLLAAHLFRPMRVLRLLAPLSRQDVAEICSSLRIPFVDLNAEEAFASDTWLFVDRVHLTDEGYRLTAALLKERLGL